MKQSTVVIGALNTLYRLPWPPSYSTGYNFFILILGQKARKQLPPLPLCYGSYAPAKNWVTFRHKFSKHIFFVAVDLLISI